MAQLVATIRIRVKVRWWVYWYLAGVVMMSHLTGLQPDLTKVEWYVRRGVSVRRVR